ncbi:polyamine ABC transporter substrate-binding protein [Vibrio methylphosphonaticus]|uniref:polyamine ABC transporter substrate-binding protein n=1 Tax=Vibrio methylphosphonaticus TaxID=2946866 RepID=UPI002029D33B|nr:spermidine/putrescine ABC transporter substrate-binding protein [Vibrio methylphosphonaticus]MCL9773651.1 spermidine/putrescine ABC transporter substrate-binding protein [Vibrio methylphosphonaticus]
MNRILRMDASRRLAKVLSLCALCVSSFVYGGQSVISLYNWEAFLADSVKERLRISHNVSIEETYFSDEGIRDEVMLSERRHAFDLVVIESVRLQLLANQGVVAKVPQTLKDELSSNFDSKWSDACGDYGIPYAWGTSGILYRESAFATPVTSWKALLEPSMESTGRIAMYYNPVDAVAIALLSEGKDPFSSVKQDLQQAYSLLSQQRPFLYTSDYILNFINSPEELSNIDIAFGFSGDEFVLNEVVQGEEGEWVYVIPKEGTIIWLECLAIPQGATITPDLLTTIRFLSQPQIAALNAEETWFSTPNPRALEYVGQDYLNAPSLNLPPAISERSVLYRRVTDLGLLMRQRIVEDLR